MISWEGANYLLSNIIPMNNTLDGYLADHFKRFPGSFVVNVNGVRPSDYKKKQKGYQHSGLIYQDNRFHTLAVCWII